MDQKCYSHALMHRKSPRSGVFAHTECHSFYNNWIRFYFLNSSFELFLYYKTPCNLNLNTHDWWKNTKYYFSIKSWKNLDTIWDFKHRLVLIVPKIKRKYIYHWFKVYRIVSLFIIFHSMRVARCINTVVESCACNRGIILVLLCHVNI